MADSALDQLKHTGRIVVVGASLAGLRAAEVMREKGFAGSLTLIGDEPHEPYDRPPLSKGVLLGRADAERTLLPGGATSRPSGGWAWRPPGSTWRPVRSSSPTATRSRTTGC